MRYRLILRIPKERLVLESTDEYDIKNWIKEFAKRGFKKMKIEIVQESWGNFTATVDGEKFITQNEKKSFHSVSLSREDLILEILASKGIEVITKSSYWKQEIVDGKTCGVKKEIVTTNIK